MKAICKTKEGIGLELLDVSIPKIKDNEILLKVQATSICGSDLHIFNWDPAVQNMMSLPRIIGHEFTGEVVEVGKNVTKVRLNDRVAVESHIPCLDCFNCKNNRMHICENLKIIGFDVDGSFAEFAAIPEICAWKIDNLIPPEIATLLEPLGNAVHAVCEQDVSNKIVVTLGCGPIGIFAISVAKAFNPKRIIATDINDFRLALAKKVGADFVINPSTPDSENLIKELTLNYHADIVLDMAGTQQTFKSALKYVRSGGIVIAFGLIKNPVLIDVSNEIIMKSITIKGILGRKMFETWELMMKILESHKINFSDIITHKLKLSEFMKGFNAMQDKNSLCGKVVLFPDSL